MKMTIKNFFKVTVITLIMVATVFLLTSCTIEVEGFENVGPNTSELSLCSGLFPSKFGESYYEYFGDMFETADRNAYYYESSDGIYRNEKILFLIYLKYTETSYDDAKTFLFGNMTLSENVFFESNNYCFYKNLGKVVSYTDDCDDYYIAFNDSNRTIVSLGSYFTGKNSELKNLVNDDFPAYLQLFSKYYDFTK